MKIILGFGCVEAQERERIRLALIEGLADGMTADEVLAPWHQKADEYKKLPRGIAPQRYTYAWCYDGKIFYHHINREHPFSPDGWALLKVEEPLVPGANKEES